MINESLSCVKDKRGVQKKSFEDIRKDKISIRLYISAKAKFPYLGN
jgi:hypothetical protein